MANNGKIDNNKAGNSKAELSSGKENVNNKESRYQKIDEFYMKGKSKIHSEIERKEKFLKYIKEISEERERLSKKPKYRFIRFLIPLAIVGFGILLMYIPERRIVGKNIYEFSPPPEFYFEIGKYTVVNFFASWCPPCESEIPQIIDFHRSTTDSYVIGVVLNDSPENINTMINRYGIDYPVIYDNGIFSKKLGIGALPVTLILDPQLRIRKVIYGPVTKEKLSKSITELKSTKQEK